jgi:hypothetical protein
MEEKFSGKDSSETLKPSPDVWKGKIVDVDGKYFLEVGGPRRQKIPLGSLVEASLPKEALGKSVEFIMGDAKPSVVGIKAKAEGEMGACYFILCYLPRDIFGNIDVRNVSPIVDKQTRVSLAKTLLNENVITQVDYDRMVSF